MTIDIFPIISGIFLGLAQWLGLCFINDSGYDSQDMVKVMQILDSLRQGKHPPNSSAPTPIQATASSSSRQISRTWISAFSDAPLGILREP